MYATQKFQQERYKDMLADAERERLVKLATGNRKPMLTSVRKFMGLVQLTLSHRLHQLNRNNNKMKGHKHDNLTSAPIVGTPCTTC